MAAMFHVAICNRRLFVDDDILLNVPPVVAPKKLRAPPIVQKNAQQANEASKCERNRSGGQEGGVPVGTGAAEKEEK